MDTMDSFYHEPAQKRAASSMKSNMTLDFNGGKTKQSKFSNLLNSPDIRKLMLASPELEQIIIQQGVVSTGLTPNTQILFPKSVTEEQEAYARGFVDALAELHNGGDEDSQDMVDTAPTYTTLETVAKVQSVPTNDNGLQSAAGRTTIPTVPLRTGLVAATHESVSTRFISPQHAQLVQIKEEPQRVPSVSPQLAPLPQLIPLDLGQQEGIKLERKRARNRIAATKCRTRKLERISRLEERVEELKGHNSTLVETASSLREQVYALKQQIMEHVNSGCKVMLTANVL